MIKTRFYIIRNRENEWIKNETWPPFPSLTFITKKKAHFFKKYSTKNCTLSSNFIVYNEIANQVLMGTILNQIYLRIDDVWNTLGAIVQNYPYYIAVHVINFLYFILTFLDQLFSHLSTTLYWRQTYNKWSHWFHAISLDPFLEQNFLTFPILFCFLNECSIDKDDW